MVVLLGWPADDAVTACVGAETPHGLIRTTDTVTGIEYFGIEIIGAEHENGTDMLDVSERYCVLIDILVANSVHIDYKIGRPRIWAIN